MPFPFYPHVVEEYGLHLQLILVRARTAGHAQFILTDNKFLTVHSLCSCDQKVVLQQFILTQARSMAARWQFILVWARRAGRGAVYTSAGNESLALRSLYSCVKKSLCHAQRLLMQAVSIFLCTTYTRASKKYYCR